MGRRITQIISAVLMNGHINGFIKGKIYKGSLKKICVPGLNCYSCPGALGSCPIGSLQAVINTAKYRMSLYVFGLISLFGILMGKFVCGWLCPFGLFQDLLHKIPLKKYVVPKKANNILKYFKYFFLIVFVILMPMFLVDQFGLSAPYFCEYVCPAGMLEGGIPLVLLNKSLRNAIGFLYAWKMFILVSLIVIGIIIHRPFCRYICPLGAMYGLFNPICFYKYKVDRDNCTECGACTRKCSMNIEVFKNPNTPECIRCGECIEACPQNVIEIDTVYKKPRIKKEFLE